MADDFVAGLGTTGYVNIGGSQTGTIEIDGDNDWIATYLYAGSTYLVNLRGADSGQCH